MQTASNNSLQVSKLCKINYLSLPIPYRTKFQIRLCCTTDECFAVDLLYLVSGCSACRTLLCRKNCNGEPQTQKKYDSLLYTSRWLEQFNMREVVESRLRDFFFLFWQEFDGMAVENQSS
jgi:hypothetical protein